MIDLRNAKSIQLNGKDVKRLRLNNQIIWEKQTFSSILLSASSNIVSKDETITLYAQLADANDNPVSISGETVNFISNEISLVGYSDSIIMDLTNSYSFYFNEDMAGIMLRFNDIIVSMGNESITISDSNFYILDEFNFSPQDYIYLENGVFKNRSHTIICDLNDYTNYTAFYGEGDGGIVGDLIGYAVTDATGLASVSYLGKGTGDLYIKGICGIIFNTYGLEDCFLHGIDPNDYSSININNSSNCTMTYDSTNDDYYILNSANAYNALVHNSLNDLGDVEITFDIKSPYASGQMGGFALVNPNNNHAFLLFVGETNYNSSSYYMGARALNIPNHSWKSGLFNNQAWNTWLSLKIEITSTEINYYYLSNNVYELVANYSITDLGLENMKYGFLAGRSNNNNSHVKNLKIKPL